MYNKLENEIVDIMYDKVKDRGIVPIFKGRIYESSKILEVYSLAVDKHIICLYVDTSSDLDGYMFIDGHIFVGEKVRELIKLTYDQYINVTDYTNMLKEVLEDLK